VEFLVRGLFFFSLAVFEYFIEVSIELFAVRGSLSTSLAAVPLSILSHHIPYSIQL